MQYKKIKNADLIVGSSKYLVKNPYEYQILHPLMLLYRDAWLWRTILNPEVFLPDFPDTWLRSDGQPAEPMQYHDK